jgi:hypothetical protein
MRLCILRPPISRMGADTLADHDAIVKSRMREAGTEGGATFSALTTPRVQG